jgi:hypothetical protein
MADYVVNCASLTAVVITVVQLMTVGLPACLKSAPVLWLRSHLAMEVPVLLGVGEAGVPVQLRMS